MTEPFLEALDLHAYYGQSHVLHGVSLRIGRGEAVALMGRNGMGKTTTIRAILGLTPPRRGRVRIDGRDVTGSDPCLIARAGIGYVPEGRGIFPTLSVREHLVMAERAGQDGRRAWTFERVLATFPRLAERRDHRGSQLSGGEHQMLALGRALMTNPELVILDEATEGLAPLVRREIWAVLRVVKASGMASLIVDKDGKALLGLADRAVVLAKGEVVFSGPAAALAAQTEIRRRYLGV